MVLENNNSFCSIKSLTCIFFGSVGINFNAMVF
jgi:hypothetical protein